MKTLLKPFEALAIGWKSQNDFQKARWKLTAIYSLILFVLFQIFTISLFLVLQKEETTHQENIHTLWSQKEVIFPDSGVTVIKFETPAKNIVSTQEVINVHHIFLQAIKKWIVIIQGFLLLISGVLSYFLSGRTLRPIQEKTQKQKEFLADVSHELKNPLSAIKTSLEISQQQKTWKQGELQEVFSDLESEINRLIHTTEAILELEKNPEKTKKEKIFLPEIIKQVEKRFAPLAVQKNITLDGTLENFSCLASPQDVEKVIANLLHNAIKFSDSNSRITVSLVENGKFSVQDFGIGIPQSEISALFDRFYKIDSSRLFTEESGSGLGLSLVQKICNANGWKIEVQSKEGEGSVFVVWFG